MNGEKQVKKIEYEFLPGALEIVETPPAPLGRFSIWIIFIVFVSSIIWSYFGKIDEVAVARGKVIPDGRIKVIQPLEEGVITSIHIQEGENVRAGQLLIELDSSMKEADINGLENALNMAKFEKNLLYTELSGTSNRSGTKVDLKSMDFSEIVDLQLNYKQAKKEEYVAQKETLTTIMKEKENEIELAMKKMESLKTHHSYLSKEADAYRIMYENQSIPKVDFIKKQEEVELSQKEIEGQALMIEKLKNELNGAKANLITLTKSYEKEHATKKKELADQIVSKEKEITSLEDQLSKAKKVLKYQKLVSPVDGVVQGIASQTIGGVVTPGQAIVSIVPDDTPLVVEAKVLNKDIGFIEVGQDVEVKFDTFSFQKYGSIKGEVISISPDAIEDENLGNVYKMKVKLNKDIFTINNKQVYIFPGMTVSAEVKTGKRRIIEFFLSPIMKNMRESLTLR